MATIAIDTRRRIDAIDPNIYGNFIEHLGRCIYGGVYEPGSPLSDERGFRKDVMEAVRRLRVPNLRWPGGNFVSGYHWMDGIGPKENRPRRMELAWHTVETNQFGTDGFIEYCNAVGTEPFICVNMGSGTMDEAQNWVEYCNGAKDTYYANLRRQNGHEEPYGVKYWGLGNEVSGGWQIGHKEADEYARAALEFAKVMKWVDPNIQLIACGSCQQNADDMTFNRIVVEKLIDIAEYLSIHMYVSNRDNNYYEYMGTSEHIEKYIRAVRGIIGGAVYHSRHGKKMKIAFDEWNATYSFPHEHPHHERYTLEDALVVGMFLNAFIRHADAIKIANMAQLVNIIPPIFTSPEDMFLQTICYPLELYTCENGTVALDAYCDCEIFDTRRYGKVPYLDVSASFAPDKNRISINVINRHLTDAIPVTIENQHGGLADKGMLFEINGEDIKMVNDFKAKENVVTKKREISVPSNPFVLELPPHSITMIQIFVRLPKS
ncbi:alpha-N-arabinofuranosidase [Candidatus Poribacteria bacterium]|nr:alpha-N-arabinofuranosidase [Candidatus Poribacteria bacterium]